MLTCAQDYRKIPRALNKVYFSPMTHDNTLEMSKLFDSLTSADPVSTQVVQNRKLPIWGRELVVPESSGSVARFTFGDLCNKPLSAADYLEVTSKFGTLFVEGVPRMGLGERDQARRFITFVDGTGLSRFTFGQDWKLTFQLACYENKTKLFISSEVPIYQVFSDEKGKAASDDSHMRASELYRYLKVMSSVLTNRSNGRPSEDRIECRGCTVLTSIGSACRCSRLFVLVLGRRRALCLCAMRVATIADGVGHVTNVVGSRH